MAWLHFLWSFLYMYESLLVNDECHHSLLVFVDFSQRDVYSELNTVFCFRCNDLFSTQDSFSSEVVFSLLTSVNRESVIYASSAILNYSKTSLIGFATDKLWIVKQTVYQYTACTCVVQLHLRGQLTADSGESPLILVPSWNQQCAKYCVPESIQVQAPLVAV